MLNHFTSFVCLFASESAAEMQTGEDNNVRILNSLSFLCFFRLNLSPFPGLSENITTPSVWSVIIQKVIVFVSPYS